MSSIAFTRRVKDEAGKWHELVAGEDLRWRTCSHHDDELGRALAGLPGARFSCRTGEGWRDEWLIKIGWPIWLANMGYREAAADVHTPADVLAHLLRLPDLEFWELAAVVLLNPNCREAHFQLALRQYPKSKWAIEDHRQSGGFSLLSEAGAAQMGAITPIRVLRALQETNLSQVPEGVLRQILDLHCTDFSKELAQAKGAPEWVLQDLLEEGYTLEVSSNVGATTAMLEWIVQEGNQWAETLERVAKNPNVSLRDLVQLSQDNRVGIARAASKALADRVAQMGLGVEAVDDEVALSL